LGSKNACHGVASPFSRGGLPSRPIIRFSRKKEGQILSAPSRDEDAEGSKVKRQNAKGKTEVQRQDAKPA
jgi:hypothetical protein